MNGQIKKELTRILSGIVLIVLGVVVLLLGHFLGPGCGAACSRDEHFNLFLVYSGGIIFIILGIYITVSSDFFLLLKMVPEDLENEVHLKFFRTTLGVEIAAVACASILLFLDNFVPIGRSWSTVAWITVILASIFFLVSEIELNALTRKVTDRGHRDAD